MTRRINAADASGQLDRILSFFGRAESKATALFAVNLGMLGLSAINTSWDALADSIVIIEGLGMLGLLGISFWFEYWALFPELRPKSSSSLVYFGAISRRDCEEYVRRMTEISEEEYVKEILEHVWRNSDIVSKKFAYVKYAFWATAAALPLW